MGSRLVWRAAFFEAESPFRGSLDQDLPGCYTLRAADRRGYEVSRKRI
jgi:hypothetical protein